MLGQRNATNVTSNLCYDNLDIIEDAYGINLRPLLTLAENTMTQQYLLLA
ncbi:fructose-bisphosphatase class III [Staphylococcus aureus]